jgi:acylphosphatase
MPEAGPKRRRVHVVISGRVQNVFFRASLADIARDLGIDGWVKNRPDGRVEAVFEGEPAQVDAALRWSRNGPPRARVDAIDLTDEEPLGEAGFFTR